MLRDRLKVAAQLFLAGDLLSILVSFYGAHLLRNEVLTVLRGPVNVAEHAAILQFALPAFVISFYAAGLYQGGRAPFREESRRIITGSAWAAVALTGIFFLMQYKFVSRLFFVVFVALCPLMVGTYRLVARGLARRLRGVGSQRNFLIVGSGARADEMIRALRQHSDWGLSVAGVVADGAGEEATSTPIVGSLRNFSAALENRIIDGVVFATPHERLPDIKEPLLYCRTRGIPAFVYAKIFEDYEGEIRVEDLAGIPLVTFPQVRHNDYELFLKRIFDVVVSSFLLTLVVPMLPLIGLAIKLDSRGPLLFTQTRVGMNGRRFTLYKFRTMIEEAERMQTEIASLNEMDGPVFKIRQDPRITKVGRFLRRTSLDELPQLLNVLLGQMSIVGPRPPVPSEVDRYEEWQRRRLSVKPGLTCLWQVSGRNSIDFQTWMKMDLQYIDSWSWWLDLKILLRTIPAMLRGQ